jgi:hypothetical protein
VSSLPLAYDPRAVADVRAVPPHLLPAVLEHLSRLSANHSTCSRPSSFPRPPGLESGVWLREPGGVTLVEVLFRLASNPDRILVRRVILTTMSQLPGWVSNPSEWGHQPWPVVDV